MRSVWATYMGCPNSLIVKTMSKNKQPANHQKNNKSGTNSSGKIRFFYILVLLLMIFSLFARVSAGRPATNLATREGTTARLLVFHQSNASFCEDLTITEAGNAIFSDCGNGMEKQYALNSSERSQFQSWIDTYSPVNYDRDQTQTEGLRTQLHLNSHGKQQAGRC